MPNWLFDVVCVAERVAENIHERFILEPGDVRKPKHWPDRGEADRPRSNTGPLAQT